MLLQLQNIQKYYASPGDTTSVPVIRDISLEVNAGESVAIVGPSGSGKSTLLNIIGALDKPTAGSVRLDGQDLAALSDKQLASIRNRDIGFVFQLHHLLPQCTALENVLVPSIPRSADIDTYETYNRANHLLETVGLGERIHYKPAQLSGGERQRVAVVRALINKPRLLLADEPTGSLDQASSDKLGQLLIDLNKQEGVALIVVTHSMHLAHQMERKFSLQDGKLKIL